MHRIDRGSKEGLKIEDDRMAGKANILFLCHHSELSGGEMDLLGLINNLDRDKFNPLVYTGCEGPLKERLSDLGIQTGSLDLPEYFKTLKRDPSRKNTAVSSLRTSLAFNRLITGVERIIIRHKIDIVYANTVKSACLGIPAAEKAGVKSAWRLHDCLAGDFYSRFFLWFIKRMTKSADLVICTSEAVKRDYLRFAGKVRSEIASPLTSSMSRARNDGEGPWIEVVPNGVDLEEFRPNRRNETLRDSLAKREERIIALIGRLEPWKGQEVFIRAGAEIASPLTSKMSRARNDGIGITSADEAAPRNDGFSVLPLKFLIVGGPLFRREEYEAKLKALIEELGLQEKVLMLGHRSDIPDIMAISDVIAHTSILPEPFGRDIIEAMACGKPVISTNIGGPREILTPDTGILIEPRRPDILADEIIRLINDPARMELLGRNARKRAEEIYDIKKVTKRVEEILLSL